MDGYELRLTDKTADALIYATRTRVRQVDTPEPYSEIEAVILAAEPIVGLETIRFPRRHLNQLLDCVLLALNVVEKKEDGRVQLNADKLVLIKHLDKDAISRLASLTS